MADQKAMKKRLKALMQRPENQVCSDCPEKRPTWASLIVPPPGAPPGTEKIGSFCCLECSGSHRRLGVHISFVRSVNLDSWKEWEVRAMENGGNARVNAIFEARLAQSGRTKPSHLADGPTRERYIRDKYERRKFYDPAGFATPSSGSGAVAAMPSQSSQSSSVGTPSDIARQRVASRQARMKPVVAAAVAKAPPPKAAVAQAPVSGPPEFDLLDFGSTATIAASTPSAAPVVDAFAAAPDAFASAPVSAPVPKPSIPPPPKTAPAAPTATTTTTLADEFRRSDPPKQPTTKSNDDIMALFGPPKPQPTPQGGFGMHAMNQMGNNVMMNGMMPQQQSQGNNNNMMMMNGMTPQQQPQGNNNMMMNGMTPQQQQQQMMMMMMQKNNTMMANGNGNQMMSSQMMQQPQQQQQMMMQQQQQMMMMKQQQQMMGNNSNSFGNFHAMNNNNNAMNSLAQGMQTMSMKQNSNLNDDGGFGTPMGGNGNNNFANSDAFSSLGGMNAFR